MSGRLSQRFYYCKSKSTYTQVVDPGFFFFFKYTLRVVYIHIDISMLDTRHQLTQILSVPPSACYSEWQCSCGNGRWTGAPLTQWWLTQAGSTAASPPSQNSQNPPLGQRPLIKISCHRGHRSRESDGELRGSPITHQSRGDRTDTEHWMLFVWVKAHRVGGYRCKHVALFHTVVCWNDCLMFWQDVSRG